MIDLEWHDDSNGLEEFGPDARFWKSEHFELAVFGNVVGNAHNLDFPDLPTYSSESEKWTGGVLVWLNKSEPSGVLGEVVRMRRGGAHSLLATLEIAGSGDDARSAVAAALEAFETGNVESEFQLIPAFDAAYTALSWNLKAHLKTLRDDPSTEIFLSDPFSLSETTEVKGFMQRRAEGWYAGVMNMEGEILYRVDVEIAGHRFPLISASPWLIFEKVGLAIFAMLDGSPFDEPGKPYAGNKLALTPYDEGYPFNV